MLGKTTSGSRHGVELAMVRSEKSVQEARRKTREQNPSSTASHPVESRVSSEEVRDRLMRRGLPRSKPIKSGGLRRNYGMKFVNEDTSKFGR